MVLKLNISHCCTVLDRKHDVHSGFTVGNTNVFRNFTTVNYFSSRKMALVAHKEYFLQTVLHAIR